MRDNTHVCDRQIFILSNLCIATSGGYKQFGCSREALFLRGYFQWSMSLRQGDILPVERGSRSLEVLLYEVRQYSTFTFFKTRALSQNVTNAPMTADMTQD